MAVRKPLVVISGQVRELPAGDTFSKASAGLPNVDDTADADKPVSVPQQGALDQKADLVSPALTGTPTAPTAASTVNTTQIATMAAVQAVIASDTGSAATALTLKTSRTIAISGGATGTATGFDGGSNITIPITGLNMANATAGTLAVARGGTGVTTSTGSGSNVLSVSPALTGTPTVPTAAVGTNTTQIANMAAVRAEIAALVNSSPAALDTLAELAAALGDDPNFAATTAAAIGLKADAANAALTGVPTAPTAVATTNTTQLATTAFVQAVNASDTGSAATALTLKTARTIAISGGATGTATSFNGSANISIAVTGLNMGNATAGTLAVARGGTGTTTSTGTGANVQAGSPALTGTPTVPTAAAATNNTQAASTAFVQTGLASKQDTLVSGSNIKTVNGESILGPGDIAIAGSAQKKFYFHTANTTLTVPDGVSVVRFYAGGRGGNGGARTQQTGLCGGGGGGGFAFGDLSVTSGDSVSVTINAGVSTVRLNGVTVGTANPGGTGAATQPGFQSAAGGAGGTATVSGAVTNGGGYSGGAGGSAGPNSGSPYLGAGGGSCGSPLGNGSRGGDLATGTGGSAGGGIGGAGASSIGGAGGGAGEAGTATYGGGSTSDGSVRGILEWFSDPLLVHAALGRNTGGGAAPGQGGFQGGGGDFGGGATGYRGGLMGGGGGVGATVGIISGGLGGYGGGGGGVAGGGASSTVGIGGAAFCFLYY